MEKVRSGEAVAIRASTWNAFIDAANYVKEARLKSGAKGVSSGLDVARGVEITGIMPDEPPPAAFLFAMVFNIFPSNVMIHALRRLGNHGIIFPRWEKYDW